MKIKVFTGTHPEEVASKASTFINGRTIHQHSTVKQDREYILTVVYSEIEQPKQKLMRCGKCGCHWWEMND